MEAEIVEMHARPARPYGWIGLPLSLGLIVILGTGFGGLALGLVFLTGAAILGWDEAGNHVVNLYEAMKGDPQTAEFVALILGIVIYAAIALAVFAAARFRGGANWRDLIAWHPWTLARTPRSCWVTVAATMVYSFVANEALAYFYPASQDWVTIPQGIPTTLVFFAIATISAPLTEELIFRGWLFTALRDKLRFAPSLVIASALFALAHWEPTHLYALVVFPVGLALGFIRERTGSLKASISFHAFYNGVAFLLMLSGK
ncbi:MAG: CPBP family intramembrane glutamic endopeptidase [Beijerinckiaceae bacterium]